MPDRALLAALAAGERSAKFNLVVPPLHSLHSGDVRRCRRPVSSRLLGHLERRSGNTSPRAWLLPSTSHLNNSYALAARASFQVRLAAPCMHLYAFVASSRFFCSSAVSPGDGVAVASCSSADLRLQRMPSSCVDLRLRDALHAVCNMLNMQHTAHGQRAPRQQNLNTRPIRAPRN
jgi:hypothetical protein